MKALVTLIVFLPCLALAYPAAYQGEAVGKATKVSLPTDSNMIECQNVDDEDRFVEYALSIDIVNKQAKVFDNDTVESMQCSGDQALSGGIFMLCLGESKTVVVRPNSTAYVITPGSNGFGSTIDFDCN